MTQCRICKTPFEQLMSFGKMPLANGFLTPEEFAQEYFFELAVGVCPKCSMFQLVSQPEPQKMFHDHYAFFSGTSTLMAEHFKSFAALVSEKYLCSDKPFVVEIGSNDGIMLRHFAAKRISHLGVEPSKNVAQVALSNGVNTISEFFNETLARKIVAQYGQADAILGANVMCHIADFNSVIAGFKLLLKPDGVVIFEDPYLGDVVEKTSYDQIYDEHVFLFSLSSISYAFAAYEMEVVDVLPQSTHGGSMRYVIAHKGAKTSSAAVLELRRREEEIGLKNMATFERFRTNCEQSKHNLLQVLQDMKRDGKRVVGYAATSKSTTVINYCGITTEHLEYISDTTPIKQGKFSPGRHIPVRPYQEFTANYPDAALLLGWNHQKEIFAKESKFRESGGRWIVFVPRVEVI